MRCLACHYSLKNLTEHRCPECGREFDPNDSTTVSNEPPRPVPIMSRVWLGLCYTFAVLFVFHVSIFQADSLSLFSNDPFLLKVARSAWGSFVWTSLIAVFFVFPYVAIARW